MPRRWARASLVALVLTAAALAGASSQALFPDGTWDLDEVAYLSQAEALRAGHLTLDGDTHGRYFRPFLSGVNDDGEVVFKYQPSWPAFLAVARAVTGSFVPSLVVAAMLSVLAVFSLGYEAAAWLGWEPARRWTVGLLAGAGYLLCPLFIVQAGTYLSYPAATAVLAAASAVTIRGRRVGGAGWFLVAGLLFGLGFFTRSFDAILIGGPLAVWLVVSRLQRREAGGAVRDVAFLTAGLLPFAVLYLLYNHAVTGDPMRPGFTVSSSIDTFGFGKRASFETQGRAFALDFTPAVAWSTTRTMAWSLHGWLLGGFGAVALAVVGAVAARRRPIVRVLAAQVLLVPIGYFFWWGTANAVAFDLIASLGPFYWYPAVPALCVLAAVGGLRLVEVIRRPRAARPPAAWVAAVVTVVVVVSNVVLMGSSLTSANQLGRSRSKGVARLRAPTSPSVVLSTPEFAGDPYVRAVVSPELGAADRLIALDPGGPADVFRIADLAGDRPIYQQVREHSPDGLFEPTRRRLVPLEIERGSTVEVDPTVRRGVLPGSSAYVRVDGGAPIVLDPSVHASDRLAVTLRPGPATGYDRGSGEVIVGEGEAMVLAVGVSNGAEPLEDGNWYERRYRVQALDGELRVATPGAGWRRYVFPDARPFVAEDVSSVLR